MPKNSIKLIVIAPKIKEDEVTISLQKDWNSDLLKTVKVKYYVKLNNLDF